MAVGDIKKNPLASLAESGLLIDDAGNVAPLRALIGIDADTGLPVVVTVKSGKIQVDMTNEGLATQTTLASMAEDIALMKADLAAIRTILES